MNKQWEESVRELQNFAQNNPELKHIKGKTLNILKMSKSQRKKSFEEISFDRTGLTLSENTEFFLYKENILAYTDKYERKTTITLKGIMILEYGLTNIDYPVMRMLDEINDSYFNKIFDDIDKPLTGEEKAIIITLLGFMSFYPNSSIKLSSYKDLHLNVDSFKKSVERSIDFLKSLGQKYIDNTLDKIWSYNVRGEDPVNAKMSRLNDIVIKTNGIYCKGQRKEGHYLDIMNSGHIDSTKIKFLLKKIFDKGALSFNQRESFIKLMDQLLSERYIFMPSDSSFDLLTNYSSLCDAIKAF